MRCPKCKSYRLGVVKTTPLYSEKVRIRICYNCKYTFETVEKIVSAEDREQPGLFESSGKGKYSKKT